MNSTINPCSACSMRHQNGDINKCCYETCAMLVDGDVLKSNCSSNCERCSGKPKNESYTIPKGSSKIFKTCLANTSDNRNALSCCLDECNNFECQEKCIDSYNAFIPGREGFSLPYVASRCVLFLGFVVLYQILNAKSWERKDVKEIAYTILIYIFVFVLFFYVF